jgi:hypothetical protein
LDLGLLEGRPVRLMHDIAGAGERGAWVGPSLTQVPADMVGMQVREEDSVHLLGTDTGGVQFCQEPSIDAPPYLLTAPGLVALLPRPVSTRMVRPCERRR